MPTSTHAATARSLGSVVGQSSLSPRSIGWKIAIAIGLIFLALLPPGIYSLDGNGMLAVAESLVAHHSLSVPPELGLPGRDGLFYGRWYPLQSLLAVPSVAAGMLAAQALHLPAHYVAAIFSLVLPAAFTAVTAALVALIALQLGATFQGGLLASLSYTFGTIAMTYARTFYAEPLLALLTVASIFLALGGSSGQILLAGLFSGLAVLAKPTGIVIGPLLTLFLLMRKRSLATSLAPAVGSLAGLLVYFAYNQFRFGHATMFGQPWAFSLAGVPSGILGLLISPGRGLLWYCPVLMLAIAGFARARKTNRTGAFLIVGILAGFLALYSLWSFWAAGWSWGPRLLLPALPGLAALLGLLEGRWRRAVITLAVAGFLINAPTLFAFYERYYAEAHESGVPEHDLEWSMSRAPFVYNWPAAVRQVRDAQGADVHELFMQRGTAPATKVASSRALRVVALWWWVLPAARIPRAAGALLSCLLLLTGCLILLRTAARLRRGP